jgi:SNF2 family DNA or RNA helicase
VDNPSKTLWKVHQVYSGTIICESGSRKIIDTSKAKAIWRWFYGRKIAIFYKYISEFELLTKVFPNYTTDPQVFARSSNAILLLQVAAGSMGVDLSSAEAIVFYNIDFSATNYWQARSRLFHKDRKNDAKVYWVFAQNGIEKKIYSVVQKKKDYTARYFQKDFMFNKVKDLK